MDGENVINNVITKIYAYSIPSSTWVDISNNDLSSFLEKLDEDGVSYKFTASDNNGLHSRQVTIFSVADLDYFNRHAIEKSYFKITV